MVALITTTNTRCYIRDIRKDIGRQREREREQGDKGQHINQYEMIRSFYKHYIVILFNGGCFQGGNPFLHFASRFSAQYERSEWCDNLEMFPLIYNSRTQSDGVHVIANLEAMIGVLRAALGNAQVSQVDFVEDHRLKRCISSLSTSFQTNHSHFNHIFN